MLCNSQARIFVCYWNPYELSDIKKLESVQRRFTKRIPGMRQVCYQERLNRLSLQTLERHRLEIDLCMVYRIVYGLCDLKFEDFFQTSPCDVTRGHCKKLFVSGCRRDCRKNFFSLRTVPIWNSLPNAAVSSGSLKSFKTRIASCDFTAFLRYKF